MAIFLNVSAFFLKRARETCEVKTHKFPAQEKTPENIRKSAFVIKYSQLEMVGDHGSFAHADFYIRFQFEFLYMIYYSYQFIIGVVNK